VSTPIEIKARGIALLVLGPERLPGAIRTVGLTIGRIKRGFADVRSQVEKEIGADELRQQLHNEKIMANLDKQNKQLDEDKSTAAASNVKRPAKPTAAPEVTPPAAEPAAVEEPALPTSPAPADISVEKPVDGSHER